MEWYNSHNPILPRSFPQGHPFRSVFFFCLFSRDFFCFKQERKHLSETAGFTLGFEKAEDVVFADCRVSMLESCILNGMRNGSRRTGSLDVTDDGTGLVIHELDADLGNTTARTCKQLLSFDSFAMIVYVAESRYAGTKQAEKRERSRKRSFHNGNVRIFDCL